MLHVWPVLSPDLKERKSRLIDEMGGLYTLQPIIGKLCHRHEEVLRPPAIGAFGSEFFSAIVAPGESDVPEWRSWKRRVFPGPGCGSFYCGNSFKDSLAALFIGRNAQGAAIVLEGLLLASFRKMDQGTVLKKCHISSKQAPFFIRQLKLFSRSELEQAIENLFRLDWEMKTGRVDGPMGMEAWVVNATSS